MRWAAISQCLSNFGYAHIRQLQQVLRFLQFFLRDVLGWRNAGLLFEQHGKVLRVQANVRRNIKHTAAHDLCKLELCYAPPYSSAKDPVNMAGFVIENVLTGKVKSFHWHDVDQLPHDGSITLLDVRTPYEVRQGHIDGFMNIPLDSLRDRMKELDPSKPVYAHCHSGMRSYLAARILMQNGFEVYNLSGGYRLYSAVHSDAGIKQIKTVPIQKSQAKKEQEMIEA